MFKSHLICATHYHTSINLLMPRNVCHVHSTLFFFVFPIWHQRVRSQEKFFFYYSPLKLRRETYTHTRANASERYMQQQQLQHVWQTVRINGNFRANDKDLNLINRQKVVYNIFIKTEYIHAWRKSGGFLVYMPFWGLPTFWFDVFVLWPGHWHFEMRKVFDCVTCSHAIHVYTMKHIDIFRLVAIYSLAAH